MAGMFQGKIALVTGAGLSLERATALAFAKEGAKVFVADINEEDGKRHGGDLEEAHISRAEVPEA